MTNEYITQWICDYMADPAHNTLKELPYPAWDTPLVGYSRAEDPLYPFYQQHIDPEFYLLPQQWLEKVYGHAFDPQNVSVISWVLPQTRDTHIKCQTQKECPTIEWQLARVHGEACNRALAQALESHLRSLGYEAIAPMCSDQFSWGESEKFLLISNWSERHTALICGLGTFGLSKHLITEKGVCGRFGSVITDAPLEPLARSYTKAYEYCTFCGACIPRCPAGSISLEKGKDVISCAEFVNRTRIEFAPRYGCGKCQLDVPCEFERP